MHFRFLLSACVAVVATAHSAYAAPVWGTSALGELVGSRTSSSSSPQTAGIDSSSYWDNGGFKISWTITEDDGLWTYVYKIQTNHKELIKWYLEITEGVPFDTFDCSVDFTGPQLWDLSPNDLYGVRIEADDNNEDGTTQYYTIVTDRDPVYGVAYFKGEYGMTAWTNALNYSNYKTKDTSYKNYIVRPDGKGPPSPGGGNAVPEPAAVLLLTLSGSAMLLVRHRRDAAI